MKMRLLVISMAAAFLAIVACCNRNTQDESMKKISGAGIEPAGGAPTLVTIGGPALEIAKDMIPAPDGGYVLAGYTSSKGAGETDAYLVKVTSAGGLVWDRTFGGAYNDAFYSVVASGDGGYAAAGKIEVGEQKNRNVFVVRTGGDGAKVWEKSLGGEKEEEANCIIRAKKGGFVVCGLTNSKGAGSGDAWVIKLSAAGEVEW
jgi:hypothetical protein